MKKIINNADNFVEESISGLVKSYPEIYKYSSETNKVLIRSVKGNNKVVWNGENLSGHKVSSGTYFIHIQNENNFLIEKVTLVK